MATGTLKYKKYLTKAPHAESTKWYVRAVQDRTLDFDEFVEHMAEHNSPYSRGVIYGVLTDMLVCLQKLVLDGKSVRFGALGLISVGISSAGADTADDWTTALVKDVHLNVRNTKMRSCVRIAPCPS